jgi:hypothetical protein
MVVWLLALCACESRYGAYFNVDGDGNEIRFNHVELFFGKNGKSPASIGNPSGPSMGKAFERDLDVEGNDAWDVEPNPDGSLATETVYYLPINEHDLELGYVGAVVFDKTRSDKPIGVGEVLGIQLEDGVVNKYEIELQKADFGVDLWGTGPSGPGCFAWTRQRDQINTVAVLSPNDADCDGIVANADCNDLCPTGSTTCAANESVCGTPSVCGLGCATDLVCTIQTCLPDLACDPMCVTRYPIPTLDNRLECVSDLPDPHLTVNLHLSSGKPCARELELSFYNRPCTGAHVIWRQTKYNDGWTINVTPSPNDPGLCHVDLVNANTASSFAGDHHVLVAFPPMSNSMSEWTVLLGVRDAPATSGCTSGVFDIEQTPMPTTPNDCP